MATASLVTEQKDAGQALIRSLASSSFDVAVAAWVKTSEEGDWFLYIASSVVDSDGLAAAYRRVYSELSMLGVAWIAPSEVKLIGAHNPIATELIRFRGTPPMPTVYHGRLLAGLLIDEAYIYPA